MVFPNPVPRIVHLASDPSTPNRLWVNWISKQSKKPWILPHAFRRFHNIDQNNITVFTAPRFPNWLARLIRFRLLDENCSTPRSLLTAGSAIFHGQSTLDTIENEEFFFLSLGLRSKQSNCSIYWIKELLERSAVKNRPIEFIPLIFLWNRSPTRKTLHPILGFLIHRHNNVISTGYPLKIEPGVTVDIPSPRFIRREMLAAWNQESRVIVGDKKISMQKTIDIIQAEPTLAHVLRTLAIQGKDTLPTLHSRVATYIREIAADYHHRSPWIWEKVLGSFLRNNFATLDFDQDGLDELRVLLRKRRKVILIPSHRSHLDYIFISFAIYKQGLACPLVAAGVNLSFFPLGYFFRKTGAFFIRRTFRGLDIYPHVFRTYLWMILRKFQPVEFFIEGGRSRNGALLPAKLGFLNMILEAFTAGKMTDVHFVPLAVNYDRIIEEESYIRELQGLPKQKEQISSLLKSRHLLKRKYGNVCFAVGKPISLADTLSGSGTPAEQKDRLGSTIMNRLRFTMPVTSTALVGTVLMANQPGLDILEKTIIEKARDLLLLIREIHPDAIIARECNDPTSLESVFRSAITRMLEFENLVINPKNHHFTINPQRRFQLDYLRNSIMGLLLAPALAVTEISKAASAAFPDQVIQQIFCPRIHPIPSDILQEEIIRCKNELAKWSTIRKQTLEATIYPAIKLMSALICITQNENIDLRNLTSQSWHTLFIRGIDESQIREFPEIYSKVMESEMFRSFRSVFSGYVENLETSSS